MNQIIITLLYIAAILALGLFAVNQTLDYFYKSKFLQTPCELCYSLNPNFSLCFDDLTKSKIKQIEYEYNYSEVILKTAEGN